MYNLIILIKTIVLFNFITANDLKSDEVINLKLNTPELTDQTFIELIDHITSKFQESLINLPLHSFKLDGNSNPGNLYKLIEDEKDGRINFDSGTKTSDSTSIVNNINLILIGNETLILPKNNVSVSSVWDSEGNLITTIKFNIITKVKNITKVNDVPVINGIRGVKFDNPGSYQPSYNPQIFRQGTNSFVGQRNFNRPPYNFNRNIYERNNPWFGGKNIVDDKIDLPSKGNNN